MGRTARNNPNRPHLRPVERIELSEKHTRMRLAATVLFLLIGAGALVYALLSFVRPESGWRAIEVSGSSGVTCADEFVFLYELGSGEMSALAENRAVAALYTGVMQKAYQQFHAGEGFDGVVNVYAINRHPNETLEVDDLLYKAFELIQKYGNRSIYLGPVYARYGNLFFCEDDVQLVDFDPRLSEAVRQEYGEVAAFAADPRAVDIRLLGDGQICLYVSEEYLTYAERNGIEDFIDFSWMTNAFIADYAAQVMMENGYTHGSISSYDGFIRNLDERDASYSLNLYNRAEGTVYPAATMEYAGAMSFVCLRDYPINSLDYARYYELDSGEIRTAYLDVQDGLCKSAVSELTAYSRERTCAEIMLQVSPVYISDSFRRDSLAALAEQGVHSVYCDDRTFYGTDPQLVLTRLYEEDGVRYTLFSGQR